MNAQEVSLLVMIQLLQLLYYHPGPMSISNIGISPVIHCQVLDHFKHLGLFGSLSLGTAAFACQ